MRSILGFCRSFLIRWITPLLVLVAGGFALLLLSLRYWVLPDIERYRDDIARTISQASGQVITIGEISAEWEGSHPHMVLRMIRVHDDEGNTALLLHKLEGSLSWLSILHRNFHFREIEIDQPDLIVHRDSGGIIRVGGFALGTAFENGESGFSDWLLRQERVTIRNASVLWQDDKRGAPDLELLVNLRLENRGNHHRFGILAIPPARLAAQMDVRGDLTGESLRMPQDWRGRLFARIDQADVAGWSPWVPVPEQVKLTRGGGALRLWAEMDGTNIKKLSADMRLKNVGAQLAEELPELDLALLEGKAGWQKIHDGKRESDMWYVRKLHYSLDGKPGFGPFDFSFQLTQPHAGKPGSGKMSASGLKLEILGQLADYFPISQELREKISRASPKGEMQSLWARWRGDLASPQSFHVRGSFANMSLHQPGKMPSFSGITGNIDATEKGGTLNLVSTHAKVELPGLLREPLITDTLTGHANWSVANEGPILIKLNSFAFSNHFATGSAYGTYHLKTGEEGVIDLAGQVATADAHYLARYLPDFGALSAEELNNSIMGGRFSDIRFHFKHDPKSSPSGPQGTRVFRVQAKASGVTLDNLRGWPRIENISGNLLLQRNRVEFDAGQAYIFGTRVTRAQLHVADIASADPVLSGQLEAAGPTQQFFNFTTRYLGPGDDLSLPGSARFTGEGRLWVNFNIPLSGAAARWAGNYQFVDNELDAWSGMPGVKSINGMLGFNNSGIRIRNVSARLLGGPVFVNAGNRQDGSFHLTASGTLNLANIPEIVDGKMAEAIPMLKHLQGSTAWRASIQVREKEVNLAIESSLQGLSSNFPEPFSKSSTEAIPFRLERTVNGPEKDEVSMNFGSRVSARIVRLRTESGDYRVERGTVAFGTAPPILPPRTGIMITGALPLLDLDQWLGQIRQFKLQSRSDSALTARLSAVNVQLGRLDFLGRRLNEVALRANKDEGVWRSTVTGKEISGGIVWDTSGRGKIIARLSKLAAPSASRAPDTAAPNHQKDLPALDVVVENFSVGEKYLGQLELLANHHEQNWRIEKLSLTTPDSSVSVRGLWDRQDKHGNGQRVQATLLLESNDIGKFLTRLGHPESVKRGNGKLEGTFSWQGSPSLIDYATLNGNFRISARNGQFPKFEPGLGRLFGIFNLKALPRRIILDFHDIFSEGFGFNEASADIKVNHGIAATDDLMIEGPAARIMVTGRINLEEESQDLHIKVIPIFGLATPVVGVASMIASKALQKPASPNEYDITGGWTDPLVTKIPERAATLEEPN